MTQLSTQLEPVHADTGPFVMQQGADIVVRSPCGALCLRVTLVQQEFVVECVAGRLRLLAQEALHIEAPTLALHAHETLSLQSDGEMHLHANGRMSLSADALALKALRGDVRLEANDDVRIEGERIRMNS